MAGLTPVNGMTLVRLAIALACIVLPAATAVAQDPQPPTLLSVTADAGLVTLRWTLPSDLRTIYRIEAGSGPGRSDLGAVEVAVQNWSERSIGNVPAGTYFVRIRAILLGQASAPSNELSVTVPGCPTLLAPPTLEAQTFGQAVQIRWTFGSYPIGCFPTALRIEAGSSAGAADLLVQDIPDFNVTARWFYSVPFGSYYVRVRTAFGGIWGLPSNDVRADVRCLPPPTILNPRVQVVGNAARFSWSYELGQSSDFTLTIEAGSSPGASDVGVIQVPSQSSGGFNVAGAEGHYFTRLRATNACGSTVSVEVPVTLTAECVAPEPIPFIDASMSNGANALNLRWEPPTSGGLVLAYDVEVGSAPGQADLARRTVDGRVASVVGFFETFPGVTASRAYARVQPVNACGAAPRAEVHANVGSCQNPPAPRFLWSQVNGNAVTLWWSGTSELETSYRTYVEIGNSPGASNVMISPATGSYGTPGFTTALPPGRYFARARRLPLGCNEVSNPSPEVTFVIP